MGYLGVVPDGRRHRWMSFRWGADRSWRRRAIAGLQECMGAEARARYLRERCPSAGRRRMMGDGGGAVALILCWKSWWMEVEAGSGA